MMMAQTKLLVPKTGPSSREAESSMASVVMPLVPTTRYKKVWCELRFGLLIGGKIGKEIQALLSLIGHTAVLMLRPNLARLFPMPPGCVKVSFAVRQ